MNAWKTVKNSELVAHTETITLLNTNCAKIKMTKVGISTVDVQLFLGEKNIPLPVIFGRQGVGVVSEISDDNTSGLKKGDRVVISPNVPCGECINCKQDKGNLCNRSKIRGIDIDGFMSDFTMSKLSNLYKLPDNVSDDEAVFVEYISAALTIIDELDIKAGKHVVIVGAGVLGNILSQLIMYYQAIPILIDERNKNLNVGMKTGIYYTLNESNETAKQIEQITSGRMADYVVYISGCNQLLRNAFSYCSNHGTVGISGYFSNNMDCDLSIALEKELTVKGIKNKRPYPAAINILANHHINTKPLIHKEVDFADFPNLMQELVKKYKSDENVFANIVNCLNAISS